MVVVDVSDEVIVTHDVVEGTANAIADNHSTHVLRNPRKGILSCFKRQEHIPTGHALDVMVEEWIHVLHVMTHAPLTPRLVEILLTAAIAELIVMQRVLATRAELLVEAILVFAIIPVAHSIHFPSQ
jgi:hypothetical protein